MRIYYSYKQLSIILFFYPSTMLDFPTGWFWNLTCKYLTLFFHA